MPFSVFMELALYGADGYYARPDPPIGRSGDFVTGSSLSPLFGRTTARVLGRLDRELGARADYFEAGYGGGEHMRALLEAVPRRQERRLWGWDRVPRALPPGVDALGDVAQLPAHSVRGLVFSYELFDAFPVHRLVSRGGMLRELWVDEAGGQFLWLERELTDSGFDLWNRSPLEDGQIIDVTLEWGEVYRSLVRCLDRGLIVTCDYGFERERLLDPRTRRHGTLACYRRHRVHRDPFVEVGRQDLTAHIDFSLLIEVGEGEGFQTFGLLRQAEWLAMAGLLDGAEGRSPEERVEVMQLMDLEGMGEEIRVLVQFREIDPAEILQGPDDLRN